MSEEAATLSRTLSAELNAELQEMQTEVSTMSGELTQTLARALVEGKELEGLLQNFILSQSRQQLTGAMNDVYGLFGQIGSGLFDAAMSGFTGTQSASPNIFNVSVATSDAASFSNSEAQLAGLFARLVARGQSSM